MVIILELSHPIVRLVRHVCSEKAGFSILQKENRFLMLFQTCTSDPTNKTQRKLNKMLLDLRKAGKMSDSTYKMLYSSDGLCIRFYGLPKILNWEFL